MGLTDVDGLALLVLAVIGLWLGRHVHKRSVASQPIHGGPISVIFNFLSAASFASILPTVLMTVLVLHPDNVLIAGIVWHPLVLAVIGLAACSLVFALLHAVFERGPMARALRHDSAREARGWTAEDARTSGL